MTNMANVTIANLSSSWTDPTRNYTGLGLSINATSYDPSSKVFRLKVNGNTVFSVDASGTVSAPTISIANAVVDIASPFNKANAAFNVANASYDAANAEYSFSNNIYAAVNSAFGVVNAAFASANNVAPQVAPAFNTANAGYTTANAAFNKANTATGIANYGAELANANFTRLSAAYTVVNSSFVVANAGFDKANSVAVSANSYASAVGQAANAYAASITASYTGALSSSQITGALGYTPYNATNPSGYITSSASISGSAAGLSGLYTSGTSAVIAKRRYRLHSSDGTSMDTTLIGQLECGFNYGTSSGVTGPYITFGGLGGAADYQAQFTTNYGDASVWKGRCRNDDNSTWSSWRTFLIEDVWINNKHFGSDGNIYSNVSMRAPIFYDQNDTSYYMDPNGTSYCAGDIQTRGRVTVGVGQTSSWIEMRDTDESTRYIHNNSSTIGFVGSHGSWRFRMADDGNVVMGTYQDWLSNQIRSNIFYDHSDTGYYADPNSTSSFNVVHSNNHYIRPGYMLYSDHGAWQGEYNKIQWHSSHLYIQNNGGGYLMILRRGDGGERFWVDYNGNMVASGNVSAYSDVRLKENIKTIKNALEIINKLRGVTFSWIKSQEPSYGLIAQEVEKVIPELVMESENGTAEGDEKMTVKSVDYSKIVSILIEGMKEQQKMLDLIMKKLDIVV